MYTKIKICMQKTNNSENARLRTNFDWRLKKKTNLVQNFKTTLMGNEKKSLINSNLKTLKTFFSVFIGTNVYKKHKI